MKRIMQLIHEIRNSPLAVRKRWLVLSTVVTMLLVLGTWRVYVNITADGGEGNIGTAKVFRAGLGVVSERLQNGVRKVVEVLNLSATFSNSFDIKVDPKSQNFIVEELPVIPKTKLP